MAKSLLTSTGRLLVWLCLFLCAAAWADTTFTFDDGHLFSKSALDDWSSRAAKVQTDYQVGLYLMSVTTHGGKEWPDLITDRLKGPLQHAIVVLVDLEDRKVRIAVDRATADRFAFDVPRQGALRDSMAAKLHEKANDAALHLAIGFLENVVKTPPPASEQSGAPVLVPAPEPPTATAKGVTCFQWFLIAVVAWVGWTIFKTVFVPVRPVHTPPTPVQETTADSPSSPEPPVAALPPAPPPAEPPVSLPDPDQSPPTPPTE